jgi:hypothetical protein
MMPKRSVPMAVWGGNPNKSKVGMVTRLLPPIKVPKRLAKNPARNMTSMCDMIIKEILT